MQSAKTNMNVEEVFFSIARDIKQRLADTVSSTEVPCLTLSYLHFCSPEKWKFMHEWSLLSSLLFLFLL